MPTRRELLRGAGIAAGAGLLGAGTQPTTARGASADVSDPDDWALQHDHIDDWGDDPEVLEHYQPRLVIDPRDREQFLGTYGWYADSEEHGQRAVYLWTRYSHQDSLFDFLPFVGPFFQIDAHFGDHEPVIVFVDLDSGEVEEVLYTGYHHYAAHLTRDDGLPLSESRKEGEETHVTLRVIHPHHHFEIERDRDGVPVDTLGPINSFAEAYPAWTDRGIFENTYHPALQDPWRLTDRGHWWEEGTWDQRLARIHIALDWRDAGDRDELVVDE